MCQLVGNVENYRNTYLRATSKPTRTGIAEKAK